MTGHQLQLEIVKYVECVEKFPYLGSLVTPSHAKDCLVWLVASDSSTMRASQEMEGPDLEGPKVTRRLESKMV